MNITPMEGWILCEALEGDYQRPSGLHIGVSQDKDVMSEGVAKILKATMPAGFPPMEEGTYILYRGHLRFANQLGKYYDESRLCKVFLLHYKDMQAVVEGPFTVGKYGEFRVP